VKLPLLAIAFGAALAGCGGHAVEAPPGQDDFFVTWEIDSLAFGALDCASAGAATVVLDAINVDSGARFVSTFVCDAFQGTSGPVDIGRFDVLLNLADANGGVIDQVDIGVENLTEAGTIDLGHAIFRLQ
jgi:hypothetical protein